MKNIFKILIVFILVFCHIESFGQCAAADAGDMEATALAIQPSAPISACDKVTVIAEWTNTSLFLNDLDNQCHLGTYNIALPPAFIGTTGTATIVASDGGSYFEIPVCTDSQCDAAMTPTAVLPDGITVTFIIADMDVADDIAYANQQVTSQIQWIAVDADGLNDDLTITSETTLNCGSISGTVFQDDFADGVNSSLAGEDPELEGIPVTVLDCGTDGICGNADDGRSWMTTTDADGDYLFDELPFSNFQVTFGTTSSSTSYDAFTIQDEGGDDTLDSDVSSGGLSSIINLTNDDSIEEDVDAGLFEYINISGTLYTDDMFTTPAPNTTTSITITYDDGTMITVSVTTDGLGGFMIDDSAMLPPGVITDISSTFGDLEGGNVINADTTAPSGTSITLQDFSLPVTLLEFGVAKLDNKSLISWVTGSELSSSHFDIEYSKDGKSFEWIGEKVAQGNSNTTTEYEFIHENPSSGHNYYRLKQVDLDGKFEYTETKFLVWNRDQLFHYQPNPTRNELHLFWEGSLDQEIEISLFSNIGELVLNQKYSMNLGANNTTLDLEHLLSGTYIMVVHGKDFTIREKIIKIDD